MKLHYLLYYFLLVTAIFSCSGKKETTRPVVETITESVYASGVVKSKGQYQLFPKVSGVLTRILVTEGDTVEAGQVLMEVENEQARLSAENAQIAAEYGSVAANANKLDELRSAISLAKTALKTDSAFYFRQKKLWNQNIGTKAELEQRELAYKASVTNYKTAVLRFNDLKKQLDFAARQSQKNLQISKSHARDFFVKSETEGRVYSVLKEKGEMVSPQIPVAIIGHATEFELELQVDEYDIAQIKPGQLVLLNLDSYKGKVFEAVVAKINPAMNERTRSFTVEATFVKAPPRLYPNLTTEANIVIQKKQNALTIPRDYLQNDSFVVTEGGERQKVKTGLRDYRKVEILEGLNRETSLVKQSQ